MSLPAGSNGRRRRRVVYGITRAEVAEKLHGLQHARRAGRSIEPAKLTIDQYLKDWIEDVAKPRVRASTLAEYERHTDRVRAESGGIALQNWKAPDIRALWAHFEREGVPGRAE
jgi:hypothetical protein